MIKRRRGLIVEVTEGDTVFGGGGNARHRRREELAQGLRGADGRRAAHASRRRGVDHAGIPAIRIDAAALRRDRGQLARRRQEGPELPRVRVAALRRPRGRGAGRRPEGARPIRRHPQLVGAGARATASPTTMAGGPDWGAHFGKILRSIGFRRAVPAARATFLDSHDARGWISTSRRPTRAAAAAVASRGNGGKRGKVAAPVGAAGDYDRRRESV